MILLWCCIIISILYDHDLQAVQLGEFKALAVLMLQAAAVISATKPLIKAFCSGVKRSKSCTTRLAAADSLLHSKYLDMLLAIPCDSYYLRQNSWILKVEFSI